jgi:hypothetical protein
MGNSFVARAGAHHNEGRSSRLPSTSEYAKHVRQIAVGLFW